MFGRKNIWTDETEITSENIVEIIKDAYADFTSNRSDCDMLLEIDSGNMPISRQKSIRTDIDIHTVDTIAHEIVEFKEGFHWANPINFIQRGQKDSGDEKTEVEAITLLNECYAAENLGRKQKILGHFVEVCGIGYTFLDIKGTHEDGESFFQYETLDPRYAFVVRSSVYADHRIVIGATFREDIHGNQYFTAFTKDKRFEIKNNKVVNGKGETTSVWLQGNRSGEPNVLGVIPIIEWERATDRMGVFEREIPEMNRLNLLLSDIANDVDSETQMIWWANDVEFPMKKDANGNPTGETETPSSNEWVQTYTPKDGKSPTIKPLTTPYDYAGLLNNYTSARTLILQRCYTPQRNDNSGGSTGVAMDSASGWSAAEQVANSQQLLQEASKMEEARVWQAIIKADNSIAEDSPLKKLRYADVKPNVKRTKSYELNVKINAYATGVSHGIAPEHMIKAINLFDDDEQVIVDSKPYIDRYLDSAFKDGDTEEKPNADRTMQDESDQISNSPTLDKGV